MSHSNEAARTAVVRPALPWLGAALGVMLAAGCGVLLAQLWMAPPGNELRDLATYLLLAGTASMALGWAALTAADRMLGVSIQAKAFLGSLLASGVALLNVLIVAQLMFVSTGHDLRLLVVLMVFSGVVTVFFSLWVARTTASRLAVIAGAVRALAGEDLSVRINGRGGDETAQLAADVNALAERLEAAEADRRAMDNERRELTIAISHDLRTPLASVRAMVEALDDDVVEENEVPRYHSTMRREIERLNRMIDDLFELAQLDAGALRLELQPTSLLQIAADVVDAFQVHAKRQAVALTIDGGEPPKVAADGGRIERALGNLVRNAIEHTPPEGTVQVSVGSENGWVALTVADSGEGISEGDVPHIWGRFYRSEKSRHRRPGNPDGAGLGLAIVRGIVEAHKGEVDVESAPGQGSRFTMRLPYR